MIKMEERSAALYPLSWSLCMHDQWHEWTLDDCAAERLQEPSSNITFGSLHSRGSNTSPSCLYSWWDSGSSYTWFAKRQARGLE